MAPARMHRRTRRGQQAVMDIGLAAIIATGLGLSYLQITSQDQKTANAVSEGRRMVVISKGAATFIKANQAAIQTALTAGTACGKTAAGGVIALDPIVDSMPTNATTGGAPGCQTLTGVRLIPNGIPDTNGYGQKYNLLLALRTSNTGVKYVDARLATTGATVPDDVNGAIAEAIGTAGGIYATNPNISGGQITGRTGAWQDVAYAWNNQITTGHTVINLAYALHSDVGQGLQRFADSATDHSGNKLNTSLYMSGLDSANGTGTNIYMNGTGVNQSPVNAVLGARQVDTVTLTNQTPSAMDPNVSGSASQAPYTLDDTNPATIRVNANMNITARNRFSVADGVHVTANGYTANADQGLTQGIVPGLIWDNNPNNANAGTGALAVAYDLASTARLTGTGYTPIVWVTTYNPDNGNSNPGIASGALQPIGIYAYGAMMSSVFWSAENGRYFIAPAGTGSTASSAGTIRAANATGTPFLPNGASRFASADFMGNQTPVIPQYGSTQQVRHDPVDQINGTSWYGGVTAVGLYVDGNPYVDNGANGIAVASLYNVRVGAGYNQTWQGFIDAQGRGFMNGGIVVGNGNGGMWNYNGVDNFFSQSNQTYIGAGVIRPAQGDTAPALVGNACNPTQVNGLAQSSTESGTIFTCRATAAGYRWIRNVSNYQLSWYSLTDGISSQDLDLGYHMFCSLNQTAELPQSYSTTINNSYWGYVASAPGNGGFANQATGQYANDTGLLQLIQQNVQALRVIPNFGAGGDYRGYYDWHMSRGATYDSYGGSAACLD